MPVLPLPNMKSQKSEKLLVVMVSWTGFKGLLYLLSKSIPNPVWFMARLRSEILAIAGLRAVYHTAGIRHSLWESMKGRTGLTGI